MSDSHKGYDYTHCHVTLKVLLLRCPCNLIVVTLLSCFLGDFSTASNVEIELPVPSDASTPSVRTSMGTAVYAPEKEALLWKIKSFPGGKVRHSGSLHFDKMDVNLLFILFASDRSLEALASFSLDQEELNRENCFWHHWISVCYLLQSVWVVLFAWHVCLCSCGLLAGVYVES